MGVGNVPAHNFSGVEIHDGGKVDKFLFERNIGEVRHPDMIGYTRTLLSDVIGKGSRCVALIPSFSPSPFAFVWLDLVELHRSLHPLLAHPKGQRNTPVSVTGMVSQDSKDLLFEKYILAVLCGLIVPRASHKAKDFGNKQSGEMRQLFSNKCEQFPPIFF